MTQAILNQKVSFPTVKSVRLYDFDLYSDEPQAKVKVDKNVFCLIGANGIGKTTFLNTLNFAITGAIPNTAKKYLTDKKYYRENSQPERIKEYFSGRISEECRQTAGVEVELEWSSRTVKVSRDIFNDSEIRELEVFDNQTGKVVDTDTGRSDLHGQYVREVLSLTGLNDFAQFVFVVHYIWSFGEDRHLLMWDNTALTDALYLAFGGDPDAAKQAAKLRADIDKVESNARNRKYAAKQLADGMQVLASVLEKTEADEEGDRETQSESLRAQYDQLIANVSEQEERTLRKQTELQEVDLKWADISSSLSEAQIEYQKLFSEHFQHTSAVHHHPILKASISEDTCAVCNTPGAAQRIQQVLDQGKCPVCSADIDAPEADSGRDQLKALDNEIAELRASTQLVLNTRSRLSAEHEAAIATLQAKQDALAEFEAARPELEHSPGDDRSAEVLSDEISELEKQRNLLTEESKELYKKRDQIRKELRELERALKSQYDDGAAVFVPRFRELAEEFIGIPIDIKLNDFGTQTKSGFSLQLIMDDEVRLTSNTVSESQGFFIDIALRMSLAEYMSDTPATLLIDTPEGSLDIAYEARAGSMFSSFAKSGNFILMTANLRSSELVLRLAEQQSNSGMQVVRMTEWAELTDVQKEEEALFTEAYLSIEEALAGNV
mgnify:CR=1 FL=1